MGMGQETDSASVGLSSPSCRSFGPMAPGRTGLRLRFGPQFPGLWAVGELPVWTGTIPTAPARTAPEFVRWQGGRLLIDADALDHHTRQAAVTRITRAETPEVRETAFWFLVSSRAARKHIRVGVMAQSAPYAALRAAVLAWTADAPEAATPVDVGAES